MADTFPSSDGGTSSGILFWPFVHPMANPQLPYMGPSSSKPFLFSSAEKRMVQSVNVQMWLNLAWMHFCRAGNQTCSTCFCMFSTETTHFPRSSPRVPILLVHGVAASWQTYLGPRWRQTPWSLCGGPLRMVVPKRWRGAFFGQNATWCFMGYIYVCMYYLYHQHNTDHTSWTITIWLWSELWWPPHPTKHPKTELRLVSHRWRTSSSRLYAKANPDHEQPWDTSFKAEIFFPLCFRAFQAHVSCTKRTSNLNMHTRSQQPKIE